MPLGPPPPFPRDEHTEQMEDAHNELLSALEKYLDKSRVCVSDHYYNSQYHNSLLFLRRKAFEVEHKLLEVGRGWYKAERLRKN